MSSLPVVRWPATQKDPDETVPCSLSLFALCASFWRANEQYTLGDFAWPNIRVEDGQITKGAIGYVMECTTAGRSGSKEPRWSVVADVPMTALDGSVQWTPRVGALQGIQEVTNPVVSGITPNDGLLTTSGVIMSEGTKLLVDYTGGQLNKDYTVEFEFVIGGRLRVGRQIVQIRQI